MSGGGDSTTYTNADPWSGVQPYYSGPTGLFPSAESLFNQGPLPYYPGQSYLSANPMQQASMDYLYNYGLNMQPTLDTTNQALSNALTGQNAQMQAYDPYLTQSAQLYGDIMSGGTAEQQALAGMMNPTGNPYLNDQIAQGQQQMVDIFNQDVMSNITDEAIMFGQYGGSNQGQEVQGATQDLLKSMSDYDTQMRSQAYQSDMDRALEAAMQGSNIKTGAAQNVGDIYNQALGIGTTAMTTGLGVSPSIMQAGALPAEYMGMAGDYQAQFDQAALEDAMNRYYYPQESQQDWLGWYGDILNYASPFGSQMSMTDVQSNPVTGAIGGGALGYGLSAALGATNPWLYAGLGAAGGLIQ